MTDLYIRITKTAGSALSRSLNPHVCQLNPTLKNLDTFNKNNYSRTITFVRNPYDRIISAYHGLCNGPGTSKMIRALKNEINMNTSFYDFINFILEYRTQYKELGLTKTRNILISPLEKDGWWLSPWNHFINRRRYEIFWLLTHTESQTDSIEFFLPITELTFIGRFENIETEYQKLKALGMVYGKLLHYNKSRDRRKYHEYYTDATFDIVTKMYQDDLNNFKYSFE